LNTWSSYPKNHEATVRKIYHLNLSYRSYLETYLSINNYLNTFLVDSGADVSLIKVSALKSQKFNTNKTIQISGIGQGTLSSLGTVEIYLKIKKFLIPHQFHVVEDEFPIPFEGILGLDFLKTYNADVKYRLKANSDFIILNPHNLTYPIIIPLRDRLSNDTIVLPARAEVFRFISIDSEDSEVIIPSQTIQDGIYIAGCIVSKNAPYVRIINTNTQDQVVKHVSLKHEKLSDYEILSDLSKNSIRAQTVMEKLTKNFPEFVKPELTQLCSKYVDIFALESDKISTNNFYSQKLRVSDPSPVYIKNYRTPHSQKDEIVRQVEKLQRDGIVEPSASNYNSPIILVPKKSLPNNPDKRWRLVVDYRQINKKLIADKFPLPRIDDILDQLGRAKFFSCLDLTSGFHQIGLDEKSRDITSFSTENGSFRYTRLPYGLKVAPNSFQRMMNLAFAGLSPSKTFIYMDDIIVTGCSVKHMLKNLESVFQRCRERNLKLHPDKCAFFRTEVTYLGHKCTDKGILPDSSKYDTIKNFPRPTNGDAVRRFVAFCNYYRRFIKNFASYATHLTKLTKKKATFIWSEECEKAFQYFKKALMKPQILQYPDWEKPFVITTDASKLACGAILSQEKHGIQLPIAYASRAFTTGESHKAPIEQELIAVQWAINYFRPYVYGKHFTVRSDHKPLTYLYSLKNPSSRLTRIRLELEEYDFTIEHIKGKDNSGADALSRIDFKDIKTISNTNQIFRVTTRSQSNKQQKSEQINDHAVQPNMEEPKIFETINVDCVKKWVKLKVDINKSVPMIYFKRGKQVLAPKININKAVVKGKLDLDQFLPILIRETNSRKLNKIQLSLNSELFTSIPTELFKQKAQELLTNLQIALTPKIQVITDKNEQQNLLKKFHEDPLFGGHPGTTRLLRKLRQFYYWKNITKDVTLYVKRCTQCQTNKHTKYLRPSMIITPTPQKPFDTVIIDTVGPLPTSESGNQYIITLMCDLTKYLVAVAVPNKHAKTVAKAIMEHFVLIYGPMNKILSDMGTEYNNQVLIELCSLLKIEKLTSAPYHHQTLGTVERSHRTFNEYIRAYINSPNNDWDNWIKYFTYAFNTTPSTVHGYCPFELIFSNTPNHNPLTPCEKIDPIYNFDNYTKEVKFRLQTALSRAQHLIQKAKTLQKNTYNKNTNDMDIQVGQYVLIQNHTGHKLDPVYKGPYKVVNVDEQNNVIIENNNKLQKINKQNVKIFHS